VVRHLPDFVPIQSAWIFHRILKAWVRVTGRYDVEPITVAAVLGNASFVGCEQDRSGRRTQALHLDQPQLARRQIQTGDVVAEVLVGNVVNLPALALLML